ncbi:MAG: cyoD [Gammaproteobacteria bacterium]|jgi:cytochrome o ubiquinol oxidase operon protein cyoD|nr:cyoD [Gammaproteobacteria bacterium]
MFGQKTFSAYLIGLILCILLTVAAFGIVEKRLLSEAGLFIALAALAIVQLIVQVVCFLRMNASHEGQSGLMSFLFTLLVAAILVGGTLWIMYNLNYYMMH